MDVRQHAVAFLELVDDAIVLLDQVDVLLCCVLLIKAVRIAESWLGSFDLGHTSLIICSIASWAL